jgi:hypothetical protein
MGAVALSLLAIHVCLAVAACRADVPEGVFSCEVSADCPSAQHCGTDHLCTKRVMEAADLSNAQRMSEAGSRDDDPGRPGMSAPSMPISGDAGNAPAPNTTSGSGGSGATDSARGSSGGGAGTAGALMAGAPAAGASAMAGVPAAGAPAGGASGGMSNTQPLNTFGRLVPRAGETCYELKNHQSTTTVDATPFAVGDGDHYEQFYFRAPWAKGALATSFATVVDNSKVLHHWFLFATDEAEAAGSHKSAPSPVLSGDNPVFLASWSLGAPNTVAPDDVGVELPDPSKLVNAQWHFHNSTGQPQPDASAIQICTVPASMRSHMASSTWLGTEDLNGNVWSGGAGMPPHQVSMYTSTCSPMRRGLPASEPIHLISFQPHMHRLGTRMQVAVRHVNGSTEYISDVQFSFGASRSYLQNYELEPGETILTSCTFDNTTDVGVPYGPSSDNEMCYLFVYAWPAHALSNSAVSLLGVTDTCW